MSPAVSNPVPDRVIKNDEVHEKWTRRLLWTAKTDLPLKVVGTTVFLTLFFIAYFWLLNHPMFPVTVIPVTFLDRWIGFEPWSLVLYASLWVYATLPLALQEDRRRIISYGWAATGLSLAAMLIFFFWPTATPKPDIDWALYPSFSFLKTVDQVRNACPSLHAAFAVFSGLWLERQFRRMGAPAIVRILNGFWCLGILYSTLATRQHVAIDLFSGAALGAVAFALHLQCLPKSVRHADRRCEQAPPEQTQEISNFE
ncbi:MAG: phosphatase PAP2 family protein [Terriglobia bacterium]